MPIMLNGNNEWVPCNLLQFVEFWYGRNNYPLEFLYTENIGVVGTELVSLTERNIRLLWVWKTWGGPVPGGNVLEGTVDATVGALPQINAVRGGDLVDVAEMAYNICPGPVFGGFVRHIANPLLYPIIDQNVYRVYRWATEPGVTLDIIGGGLPVDPDVEGYSEFFWDQVEGYGLGFRQFDRGLLECGRELNRAAAQEPAPYVPPW